MVETLLHFGEIKKGPNQGKRKGMEIKHTQSSADEEYGENKNKRNTQSGRVHHAKRHPQTGKRGT